MNKKLMAVAVAGALAAPAAVFAQASSVQIYGRLNVGIDQFQDKGASTPGSNGGGLANRTRIYDSSSRLGFRGTEDLGNGLKAIFLIESGFNADNGTAQTAQGGQANTSTGTIASRIAHVGLDASWGTLTFGRSNVWWGNGTIEQTAANYVNAGNPLFSGSFGSGMGVGITRVSNVMQYTSPSWNGFNTQVSYSPNNQEAVQQTSTGVAGANDAKGALWGVTVQWAGGPFAVGYDWVQNKSNGTNLASYGLNNAVVGQVTGHKFRAGWSYMPGAQISFLWVQSNVKNGGVSAAGLANGSNAALAAGSNGTLKQTGWGLNWEHTFGNIQGLASYSRTGNATGCSNTEIGGFAGADGNATTSNCAETKATSYMLGARYLMSKRTAAYVTYNAVTNGRHYHMDYAGGGITSVAAQPAAPGGLAGADPRVWALGVIHNF